MSWNRAGKAAMFILIFIAAGAYLIGWAWLIGGTSLARYMLDSQTLVLSFALLSATNFCIGRGRTSEESGA